MNFNYNSDKFYNEWLNTSIEIFSKWSDDDFYSNKATHIYFYSEVNDESVSYLQEDLQHAAETKINNNIISHPKPIVIHLNSPGGSVLSENLFNVMMITQRIPLCVIVETLCASAATTLALLAPYRLMIDFSSYLIHDSFGSSTGKEHEKIASDFTYLYQNLSNYLNLLRERTILSDKDIKKFISRDISLDPAFCLKNKIIDRILKFPKIKNSSNYSKSKFTDLSLKLNKLLKKTNLNHIYIDTNKLYLKGNYVINGIVSEPVKNVRTLAELSSSIDTFYLKNDNIIKPVMIHFKPSVSFYLNTNCNPLELISLQYRIALLQKKVPVIALIEGPQALDNLATILMCPIRIMLTPSIISSYFSISSQGSAGYGFKTIDILYNTTFKFKMITKFTKKI